MHQISRGFKLFQKGVKISDIYGLKFWTLILEILMNSQYHEKKIDLNENYDKPDNNMHNISQGIKELVTTNSIL